MAIDTNTPRTRRAILVGALGAAAASVATAVGRANPVTAANNDPVLVGHIYSATAQTGINATGTTDAFYGSSDSGSGFSGITASGDAVYGLSDAGNGVHGVSSSYRGVFGESISGDGVVGRSGSGGAGVKGLNSGGGTSVYGLKTSGGNAVWGDFQDHTSGWAAVYGSSKGGGPSIYGENFKDGNGASGVARGTGSGVYGQSDNGRGGTFAGRKAQLHLVPSAAAGHPRTGGLGDLFLDKNRRLWFCKGGTTWVKLA